MRRSSMWLMMGFMGLVACTDGGAGPPDGEVGVSVLALNHPDEQVEFDIVLWAQVPNDPMRFVKRMQHLAMKPQGGPEDPAMLHRVMPCSGGVTHKVDVRARITDVNKGVVASAKDSASVTCGTGMRVEVDFELTFVRAGGGGVAGINIATEELSVSTIAFQDFHHDDHLTLGVQIGGAGPDARIAIIVQDDSAITLESASFGKFDSETPGIGIIADAVTEWSLPEGPFDTTIIGLLLRGDDPPVTSGGFWVRFAASAETGPADAQIATAIEPIVATMRAPGGGGLAVVTNVELEDDLGALQDFHRVSFWTPQLPSEVVSFTQRDFAHRDADGVHLELVAVGAFELGDDGQGGLQVAIILEDRHDEAHVSAMLCTVSAESAGCEEDAPDSGFGRRYSLQDIVSATQGQ